MTEEQLDKLEKGKDFLDSSRYYTIMADKYDTLIGKGGHYGWHIHLVDENGRDECLNILPEDFDKMIKLLSSIYREYANNSYKQFKDLII